MSNILKNGSQGASVKQLQENLIKLGYDIKADGIFGKATEEAVRHLQQSFGYTVDGLVGDGTQFLINQQMGLNWNKNAAAKQKA